MNSPFMGDFYVSQCYKPGVHNGLDIVAISSTDIHSTVKGTVEYSGWENNDNHYQGFGLYVCIRTEYKNKPAFVYFGHLSETTVKTGDKVEITQKIGIQGSTGNSTGPHCHYEIRRGFFKGATVVDPCEFSGIENIEFKTQNDGYNPSPLPENCKITKTPGKNEIIITW